MIFLYSETVIAALCSDEENIATFERLVNDVKMGSTTSQRRYRFSKALEFWQNVPIVRTIWDFVADAYYIVDRFVRKVVKKVVNKIRKIEWAEGVEPIEDGREQFYLIRLLGHDDELIWSKVGTTARSVDKRMREHLRAYKKYGVERIVVDRVWDCGEQNAEAYESAFRSFYMNKYPNTWRKNDRFTGVLFDLDEAEKIFERIKSGNFFNI